MFYKFLNNAESNTNYGKYLFNTIFYLIFEDPNIKITDIKPEYFQLIIKILSIVFFLIFYKKR